MIPNSFYMINTMASKKKVRKVSKVVYDDFMYVFEKISKGRLILANKIKNGIELKEFLTNNLIAVEKVEKNPEVELNESIRDYFMPNYLKMCWRKEKNSISIIGQNL